MNIHFSKLLPKGLFLLIPLVIGPVMGTAVEPVPVVRAAEAGSQAEILARKLQLEGTQLQLQGNLPEALEKYRQSLALRPNDRLQRLVDRLSQHARKNAMTTGQAKTTAPAKAKADSAPVQAMEAAPAPGGLQSVQATAAKPSSRAEASEANAPATIGTAVASKAASPAPVVHHPASPQEALVYDFVDWALGQLDSLVGQGKIALQTRREYTVTRTGDSYQVRLDPFILTTDEKNATIDLGPLIVTARPRATDTLAVHVQVPGRIPFLKQGVEGMALVIGQQDLALVWERKQKSFPALDMDLANLKLDLKADAGGEEAPAAVTLGRLSFHSRLEDDGTGQWTETYRGGLNDLLIADGEERGTIGSVSFSSTGKGTDLANYLGLKEQYRLIVENSGNLKPEDLETISHMLDHYLKTLASSNGKILWRDIHFRSGNQDIFGVDQGSLVATMSRAEDDGHFLFNGTGKVSGVVINEPDAEQPISCRIKAVSLHNDFRLNPIPPTLFSDIYASLTRAESMQDKKEQENYLTRTGLEYGKTILDLIGGGSTEIAISGVRLNNVMPQPITLGKAAVGNEFDTGTGDGGTYRFTIHFSDFTGMDQGMGNIPRAASLNLELSHIPSLLALITDPTTILEQGSSQLQQQAMMNGMNLLFSSGLTLSLVDSFIAFPDSRLDIGMKAQVNQNARYLSTGFLKLAMENPDKFNQIVNGLFGDPDLQQMLATVTALANRTTANGRTVDRIDAQLTPEGRIMVNSKDVTAMFLPQTEEPVSQQHQGETAAGQNPSSDPRPQQ